MSIHKFLYYPLSIVAITALGMTMYLGFGFTPDVASDFATVAMVDEEPVKLGEFNLILVDKMSEVRSHFYTKLGVSDRTDFWTHSFDGERPLDRVKKLTMDELVSIKIQQILMKKNKIINDISYEAFVKNLQVENSRRQNAIKNKEVIYGLQQFDERTYYSYLFNNNRLNLQTALAKDLFVLSEEQLQALYEKNKLKYTKLDRIKITKITVSYTVNDKESARNRIDAALLEITNGADFADVAKKMNKSGAVEILTFGDEYKSLKLQIADPLYREANKLLERNTSGIIETLNNSFVILQLMERKPGGLETFDEVKGRLKNDYVNEKYDELVKKAIGEAQVTINDKVYSQINVR